MSRGDARARLTGYAYATLTLNSYEIVRSLALERPVSLAAVANKALTRPADKACAVGELERCPDVDRKQHHDSA